ncbi:FAD-binding protein [Streptomyces sparsus]
MHLPEPTRRTVLQSMAAAAVVIGFDPTARAWATEGGPPPGPDLAHTPPLDGTLLTDEASRTSAADDYGHIVHRRPAAVLRPGSVADVVAMIRYCREHGIPVAPRGQGHATFGQGQVENGLVIETTPLDAIGPVDGDTVTVGAGAKWSDVARATLEHGLTPPVFTDYVELSVGGTLSVGGIGGQTHGHGAQVDTVTELRVVTGAGEEVRCSPTRHADLFDTVRAGLGQCAVVVGATLRLVPAPQTVRHYLLPYTDLETFLADQRTLAQERRFDYLEGQVTTDSDGAFRSYLLEAVAYGPPAGPAPDDTRLLAGLRHDPAGASAQDMGYYAFVDRLGPVVAQLKQAGLWDQAHPWLNLLLPGDSVAEVAADLLSRLTPADVGPAGVVLLYPLSGDRLHAPMLSMPHDPVPYLLAVLRTCPPEDEATVQRLVTANREAYETVRAAGGKQYPVGSIPFGTADWEEHFGPAWHRLRTARHRYDPDGLLTPGQHVF